MSRVHHTTSTEGDFAEVTVIEGSARRRYWSPSDKARIVAESFDRAVSVSEVARRHGLNPNQLFTWRRQLRDHVAAGDAPEPAREPADVAAGAMEIVWHGATVRVAADVDGAALGRVLAAIRARAR